ncbi:MAG: PKD domain-containing protein [Deltaproteobacteria bacterium]|nr:PKD domain-containing protein [Nannocystaceae bacterium]
MLVALLLAACNQDSGAESAGSDSGSSSDATLDSATAPSSTSASTATDPDDSGGGPDLPPANEPPIAMFEATPSSGVAPLSVMFDASASSDPDGEIVSYEWNFSDAVDAVPTRSRDYVDVGCHPVELTVTDDDGATASAETTIVVAQGVAELPAMATVDLAPLPSAVLPRDLGTNEGTASFHGTVASQGYTHVLAEVLVGEMVDSTISAPLCGAAPVEFAIDVPIPAELTAFDVRLSLIGGEQPQEIYRVADLVAGDLYLIQGQSNAAASIQNGDANVDQGPFVRSFGTNSTDGNASANDVAWRMAEGNAGGGQAAVGQWGLHMGAELSAIHGVPIGILNGALGGQPIGYFQRNDAVPDDPATNYGRLLTRMRTAGIDHSLRAILWYQGESDGGGFQAHHDGFLALLADWTEDYPGFERVYVTQLRAGCGGDLIGTQEVQRQLADDIPTISVMSTTGLDAHDGCHYAYEGGYRQLGDRYVALLGRDLYGDMPATDVAPPNPESAQLGNGGTEVVITMRNAESSLSFAEGAHVDFRIEGVAVAVTGGSASGNEVTLTLASDATGATGVTYLGHIGAGPWILNENGVGLLAFGNLPLSP